MNNIRELLYKMVSVQSDTGTSLEINMAECIFDMINELDYFKLHPELCGKYDGNDFLKRPVVWALKKGKSNKTIVLTGHYDAVGIEPYGSIKTYALNPNELKEKLKAMDLPEDVKTDLEDANWHFGRGINDMKAGLAINIDAIDSIENEDVNILFMAVHDEENLSAGMRQSTRLLVSLAQKYDLDYRLIVITEPHIRDEADQFKVFTGTVGKIMPLIVVKGKTAHSSDVMKGLNSTAISSQIISELELNPTLCSSDMGMTTPPPTVLYARDLKSAYDASVPEYSAVYLSFQFLKNKTAEEILDAIGNIAKKSFEKVLERYYDTQKYLNENTFTNLRETQVFAPLVYTFEEIEQIAKKNSSEYEGLKNQLYENVYGQIRNNEITVQEAGILIVKKVIELSMINEPLVVIGFIPPYYPPANNRYLSNNSEIFEDCIEEILNKNYGLKLDKKSYFMGISDGSYTSCTDRKSEEKVMASMVTSQEMYNIPFEYMEKISSTFLVMGPWGKDYHTITERVYMPDVEKTVPELIRELVRII